MTPAEIDNTFRILGLATEDARKTLRFEALDQQENFAVRTFVGTTTSFCSDVPEDDHFAQPE
jgi:hypothetical protein